MAVAIIWEVSPTVQCPQICHCTAAKGPCNLAVPGRITQEGSGEIATASPRLHPKGTSSRFALRAPRCFAPCNDTSGWCGCGNGAQRRIGTAFAASRTGRACPAPAMAYRYRRFSILRSHRSMPNDTAALRTARTRIMASVLRYEPVASYSAPAIVLPNEANSRFVTTTERFTA